VPNRNALDGLRPRMQAAATPQTWPLKNSGYSKFTATTYAFEACTVAWLQATASAGQPAAEKVHPLFQRKSEPAGNQVLQLAVVFGGNRRQ